MALVAQAFTFLHQYIYTCLHPTPSKSPEALKVGVISSAQINTAACKYFTIQITSIPIYILIITKVIHPAESHPSVILYAIASRDLSTAQKAKEQYKFTKAYGSYEDLLDDPEIDFVYISTPNGLHYEWAAKSLKAGKHVLCEKPFTSNAAEAKELMELAKDRGLVIEEAVYLALYLWIWGDEVLTDDSSIGSSILRRMHGVSYWIRRNTAISSGLMRL